MAKVRTGLQQIKDGPVILKQGAPGGLRKMRCPHCHGLATAAHTAAGKAVYKCTTTACGAEFTHSRM